MLIKLPAILSIAHPKNFLKAIQWEESKLELDCSATVECCPSGYAGLVMILESRCEQKKQVYFKGVRRSSPQELIALQKVLQQQGQIQGLPRVDVYDLSNESLLFCGLTGVSVLFGETIEKKFKTTVAEEKLFACRLMLNELMQNAADHSGAERFFVFIGIVGDRVELGCFDAGVSLPGKLKQKYPFDSDDEAVLLSCKKGVSTRRARSGGLGLWHCMEYMKQYDGTLTVLTGRALVRRYLKNMTTKKTKTQNEYHGTWVVLSMEKS